MKEKIVVICPGRGTYTQETLHYLQQFSHQQNAKNFIGKMDQALQLKEGISVSDLDNRTHFDSQLHTLGELASPLIYTCSYADFLSIDPQRFEVQAICGNSMGWYIALACAGVLTPEKAFEVIYTMGAMMKEKIIGGQIIYPIVDEHWREDHKLKEMVYDIMKNCQEPVYPSIYLGGYLVIGGSDQALSELINKLPRTGIYPLKLHNHAAFHTPLLEEISEKAFELIPQEFFQTPQTPLIDGRGKIWNPNSSPMQDLYDYTFGHQVYAPYDFGLSLSVALKEFAPSKLVLLGPGSTLGGSIGQILISLTWRGIKNKKEFTQQQSANPYLLSMGWPSQRKKILSDF